MALVLATVCCVIASAHSLPRTVDPFAVPEGLLIGAGVSALQTEGAWDADGKAESSVDYLVHLDKLSSVGISAHSHDVAADSYHRFREDVEMAARLKLKVFRFSMSWPRILPTSNASQPNQKGVQHYHDLIDEILRFNMTPLVTLYHFDHPQSLESFNGWYGREMIDHFSEYAKFVFEEYGSKVKLWTTVNEPNVLCTYFAMLYSKAGLKVNEDMDHFVCQHNVLLAHAKAYRHMERAQYRGKVGLNVALIPAMPNSTRSEDVYAANVLNEIFAGGLYNPVIYGDYPEVAKEVLGNRLPVFSEEEKRLIKDTADFLSFNVYNGLTAGWRMPGESTKKQSVPLGPTLELLPFVRVEFPDVVGNDPNVLAEFYEKAKPIFMRECLLWTWQKYKKPLAVSENGFGDVLGHGKNDNLRANYHSVFLQALVTTMKVYDIPVLAYSAWSLIDSWEFSSEYKRPFGLVHVDYETGSLNRSLKDSSWFWIQMAETGIVPTVRDNSTDPTSSSSQALPWSLPVFILLVASLTN